MQFCSILNYYAQLSMTRHSLILISTGLILIPSSCGSNNVDLGNNYVFQQNSTYNFISPENIYCNTSIHSDILDYNFNDKYIIVKQKPSFVYHQILITVEYSSRYSIYSKYLKDSTSKPFNSETTPSIRQAIKSDSTFYEILKSKGVSDKNGKEDQDKVSVFTDSVLRSDPFYVRLFSMKENYWIIDKEENFRYGPFTKEEFDNECITRNIKLTFEGKV